MKQPDRRSTDDGRRYGLDGMEIMPECRTCGLRKSPRGRSVPLEMANGLCDRDCPGYDEDPRPSSYWRCDEPPLPGDERRKERDGRRYCPTCDANDAPCIVHARPNGLCACCGNPTEDRRAPAMPDTFELMTDPTDTEVVP